MHSHHLHPSHLAGEASIRWHSERDHPLAARDRDDKPSLGRDHGLISELERSLYTRWCAFCFVRVSMPPPNQTHAYTFPASHAARVRSTRARTCAHCRPFYRVFVRGRSPVLLSHPAGHYSARFWCLTIIPGISDTFSSGCARWWRHFCTGRYLHSPFLSRRVLEAAYHSEPVGQ